MNNSGIALAKHHYFRARTFFQTAEDLLTLDIIEYGNSIALLSVHFAISLTDAVRLCYTGKRGKGENHRDAVKALRKLCGRNRIDDAGSAHFEWLIARKTDFAYGDRRLDKETDILRAVEKAAKFSIWVAKSFPEVIRFVGENSNESRAVQTTDA